jgi:hypothetical protein
MKLTVSKWKEQEEAELSANGLIRINPNKPEFGSLMLISQVITLSSGFMNKRNKVGFVVGELADLEELIADKGIKEGTDWSVAIGPHRIVTLEKVESEVPLDKNGTKSGYREKINPTTEETLTKYGEVIYWKTEVVAEGSDITDEYIQHDIEPAADESRDEFAHAEDDQETGKN